MWYNNRSQEEKPYEYSLSYAANNLTSPVVEAFIGELHYCWCYCFRKSILRSQQPIHTIDKRTMIGLADKGKQQAERLLKKGNQVENLIKSNLTMTL